MGENLKPIDKQNVAFSISIFSRKGSGCLVRVILNEKKTAAILTNHHVVKNEEMAVKTMATFNFDGCGGEPFVIKLHPDIVFKTSIGEVP